MIAVVGTGRIGQLPLIGGHRALDLVNTVARGQPAAQRPDHLQAPEDLLVWSQRTSLTDAATTRAVGEAWNASPAAGTRALTAVQDIRESLFLVLTATLDNPGRPEATQGELDHISIAWASSVSRARLKPGTTGTGAARWVVTAPPALLIADLVTQDAVGLLCDVDLTRLGRCPVEAGGCGWLFLDHSRNRSRRWCTMEDCGTGAKASRLTERRRTSRAASR
jgi:predicted RNA-binding Zn ribbon-like protein